MFKKVYFAILLLLATGLVIAWHFLASSNQSPSESSNNVPDLGAEAPISVKVQYARQGTLVLRLTANGYTRAVQQVPLTAQVSGVVDSLPAAPVGCLKARWCEEENDGLSKKKVSGRHGERKMGGKAGFVFQL